MDTTTIIILAVLGLIILLLTIFENQINYFMENKLLPKATIYATEVQAFLFALLGAIFTELWRAVSMLDWFKILICVVITILIVIFILDIRSRSTYRQRWLDSQSTKNLTALIEGSLRRVLREDNQRTKKAIKEALREDRNERRKIVVSQIKSSKKDRK